jgi:hypothetical protein
MRSTTTSIISYFTGKSPEKNPKRFNEKKEGERKGSRKKG